MFERIQNAAQIRTSPIAICCFATAITTATLTGRSSAYAGRGSEITLYFVKGIFTPSATATLSHPQSSAGAIDPMDVAFINLEGVDAETVRLVSANITPPIERSHAHVIAMADADHARFFMHTSHAAHASSEQLMHKTLGDTGNDVTEITRDARVLTRVATAYTNISV